MWSWILTGQHSFAGQQSNSKLLLCSWPLQQPHEPEHVTLNVEEVPFKHKTYKKKKLIYYTVQKPYRRQMIKNCHENIKILTAFNMFIPA